jgi:hypothetical protein
MRTEQETMAADGHNVWLARATAVALGAASRLNWAGLALGLANLVLAGVMTPTGLAYRLASVAAVLLWAAQLWVLVRIEIDRHLFDALAQSCSAEDLDAVDHALATLGWGSAERTGRPLAARSGGALRFLRQAGALAALQLLAALFLLLAR